MREITKIMKGWEFTGPDGTTTTVDLPHTWNARDGQDGGNDYWRGTCIYRTRFAAPQFNTASHQVWIQFDGVNASAHVVLNGSPVCNHDGGLGGSHKVAFQYAVQHNFDYLIVLHGDDQGDIRDVLPLVHSGRHRKYDCCLGSRFMPESRIKGYSTLRVVGNYGFNWLFSLVAGPGQRPEPVRRAAAGKRLL